MKLFARIVLALFLTFLATFAAAQTIPQGTFKHIIIVVQENRTPDNLFGAGGLHSTKCGQEQQLLIPGADLDDGGYGYVPQSNGSYSYGLICNTAVPLSGWDPNLPNNGHLVDPSHTYEGWLNEYLGYDPAIKGWTDNLMAGFCWNFDYPTYGSACPAYSYVPLGDPNGNIQPYFDIATDYGFANYMFATHQGPSSEGHEFLFSGTSAPTAPGTEYSDFFAADLPTGGVWGCTATGGWPEWVDPYGDIGGPDLNTGCYTHDTLVTDANDCTTNTCGPNGNSPCYCNRGNITWRYYTRTPPGDIWDAPAAIPEVCYQENDTNYQGQTCGSANGGEEWNNHMVFYNVNNNYSAAPIFDDLTNCSQPFPQISWVIPDGAFSDHPQSGIKGPTKVYGPSYVGDIVDTVGTARQGKYWNGTEPTAVFVTWDDWGGWFDHIKPYVARREDAGTGFTDCDPSTQWGCGYTSGFRVPLLVVSEYTGTCTNPPSCTTFTGYVSGACGAGTQNGCPYYGPPNFKTQYVHDFGSILAFTEWNFGMGLIYPKNSQYPLQYADGNAPDNQNNNVPLSDFFGLWNGGSNPTPRPFQPISTDKNYQFFQNFYANTGTQPTAPDDY